VHVLELDQLGRGLIAADGASHKRQKKAIAPGFTSVKIREYTSAFYDCAHKVRLRKRSSNDHL
jgi:cytochrome P450